MPELTVYPVISADGRPVAEAEVATAAQATELIAAGRAGGAALAWAYSDADLVPLGFSRAWGYRRMTGPARPGLSGHGPDGPELAGPPPGEIGPIGAEEDTAELWAAAFRGQWGHKTPTSWPPDLPPGTRVLGLRRDGLIIGCCRVEPASGLLDAPGLLAGHRDDREYRALLTAALAAVTAPEVAVESWGEGPERVLICEQLGLRTVEYCQGWELDLAVTGAGPAAS